MDHVCLFRADNPAPSLLDDAALAEALRAEYEFHARKRALEEDERLARELQQQFDQPQPSASAGPTTPSTSAPQVAPATTPAVSALAPAPSISRPNVPSNGLAG